MKAIKLACWRYDIYTGIYMFQPGEKVFFHIVMIIFYVMIAFGLFKIFNKVLV